MGYGAALGGLAGGFAQGYSMGEDSKRRKAEERRREEEHRYVQQERERERQIREGTGQYIATEGQEVTTDYTMAPGATGNLDSGDVYTPTRKKQTQEGAWQGAARHAARLGADPTRVAQIETTGLQLAGKRRDEKYAKREESVDDFLAGLQGLPDDQRLMKMAQFATNWGDDGKSFGVERDPQGGFRLVMTSEGQARGKTFRNLAEVEQQLRSYASPKYRKEGEELGLKTRGVAAQEETAAAAKKNAESMEKWRQDQAKDLLARRQGQGMYNPDRHGYTPSFQIAGQLQDGTPVVFNQRAGKYQNGLTGQPLDAGQLRLFQRATGERPQTPEALGQTGLIKIGSDLFTQDPRDPNKLLPVMVPGRGNSLLDRLAQAEATHDPQGAAWQQIYQQEAATPDVEGWWARTTREARERRDQYGLERRERNPNVYDPTPDHIRERGLRRSPGYRDVM